MPDNVFNFDVHKGVKISPKKTDKLPFLRSIKVVKYPKRDTQLCCFSAHIRNKGSNTFSILFPLYSNNSGPISFLTLQSINVTKKVKKTNFQTNFLVLQLATWLWSSGKHMLSLDAYTENTGLNAAHARLLPVSFNFNVKLKYGKTAPTDKLQFQILRSIKVTKNTTFLLKCSK